MSTPLRVALAQLNTTVGDIDGNERAITDAIRAARDQGAQLVLTPELAVTGYPPEDLLLKDHFLRAARDAVNRIAAATQGIVALVGFPELAEDAFNALAVLADGQVQAIYRKVFLPNYGVFDEHRYFQSGSGGALISVGGHRIGLSVCEDIWRPGRPVSEEALAGATLLVNISASPYHKGKGVIRERMLAQRARDNTAAVAFCNLVGGQDELVFDGHSVVLDHEGEVIARAAQFEEELLVCSVDLDGAASARLRDAAHRPAVGHMLREIPTLADIELPAADDDQAAEPMVVEPNIAPLIEPIESEVYAALVLGVRDYVTKNGFDRVVLGLSGGVDSTLVALIAVDALGADRVSGVVMPSRYSSEGTQNDARTLARNLGIDWRDIPIGPAMEVYDELLAESFEGTSPGLAEENIQARIRGNLLMALSNKFGWLVLTTGNKSEMSVGYSTLYGDMAGGLAVIRDCAKTLVYRLIEQRMRQPGGDAVPRSIIDRPPSAELRPDQRDEDSLPPYEVLDEILEGYIEHDLGREQLIRRGLDPAAVTKTIKLVDRNEYKRRQAPPGIKITPRALGRDRRMPITNRYPG
jgi:NAD+ synthase (glutamine-hydrolysing)